MDRISTRTGKVILSVILSLSSIPALAADSRFQKQNSGNSLNIDGLTIGTSDVTAAGLGASADAIYLVTTGNYGDLNLTMSGTNVDLNMNNVARAMVTKANQANISLTTDVSNSTVKLVSRGSTPGNVIGILSEGGNRGANQKHNITVNEVTVSVTSTGDKDAVGIYAWSYATADEINISLNGVNNINAVAESTNLVSSGNATGIGVGSSLVTNIIETGSSRTISAETSGLGRVSHGINVFTVNGENKISTRSTINSTSHAGSAYGIRIAGSSTVVTGIVKNEVIHMGDINVEAANDAYGIGLSHTTFKNNVTHSGELNIDSSSGSAYGIHSTGNDITIESSGSINVNKKNSNNNGNNGYGIYSSSTGNSAITTDATISASGATSGTAIYSETTTTGTNKVDVRGGGNVQGDTVGVHAISDSGEQIINNSGNISSANGQAILSTNNTSKTTINNRDIINGATAGIEITSTSGEQIIDNFGNISSANGQAILSTNDTGRTTINNREIISGTTAGIEIASTSCEQIINNFGNISSTNGQAILSTNGTGKTIIGNGGVINGATAGIEITGDEQTINNSGTISSTNDQAILSTNTSGTTTINNNGIIKGYSTVTGNNVTFENQGTLELQNFAGTSTKGTISYTIGNPGGGKFTNSGTIKFSDANFDGTNTHATFNVANFTNSGRIDLTGKNPTGATTDVGDIFTINGNYISNGGSLFLNTVLDDGSGSGASDLLKINGNVTTGGGGATSVYITPTSNSLGQLTTGKGIKIIEVINGTSSADAFVLGKPLTSGAYEYVLGQDSSVANTTDPNWYLTSFYNNNSNQILYNPAVASYLTNQTAAVEMFQQSLFDRLTSSSNGLEQGGHERLLWLRTTMNHGSRRSIQANMSNRGRSYTVQFGSDLALWEVNKGYLHVGVMGGYGDEENTSTSRKTRTKTDGKVKGYSAGLYGTWFQQQETYLGLYLDLWSQMGWYRNEVSGASQVGTKKYNSTVWSSSLEAGYGISLGKSAKRDWVITPQLQLVYNLYDADNQHDKNNLYVSDNNATGVVARTGIKFSGNSIDKRVLEPFMEVNWLHTTAKNELKFNGQTLKDGLPRNRVETNIGLRGNINDRWSVAAQVGGQWGQNHFNQYEGQFNINYRW